MKRKRPPVSKGWLDPARFGIGIRPPAPRRFGFARRRPVPAPVPFLGTADFSGDDNHRPNRPLSAGRGLSTYGGQIFFTHLPRATVAGLLKPGVHLAQNLSAFPNVHPVIHLQGLQTSTSWIFNGIGQGVGPEYTELILLVPFVQKGTSPQWHNFVVRMYLDDDGAIFVGNAHYGYAKERGSFNDARPLSFEATVGGNPAFWSGFESTGPWRPGAQAEVDIPNYTEMQTILRMPVIGLYWTGLSYVASAFDFDFSNVNVAPIACAHRYHGAFTPGMPGGTYASVPHGAIDIEGLGWRVEFPPANPY